VQYTVYGIRNCNTVKKALSWLTIHNIPFSFYDYKKQGVSAEKLKIWEQQAGWQKLLNKKGTTWRQLGPERQAQIRDAKDALELMQEKTSIIKRPLIEEGDKIIALGFEEEEYGKAFL